ncbi:hypothetical protein TNCV_1282581 [Trichonephila clavipes]|uniref:Uncharacterized protein n=1 Tax=Trichonephila clavipes TaxID=2585209 RepID=A0A8X6SQ30_TRICX|nr:hypothetical protein TNCV_1282581 [Trichonephila clavipes]
MKRFANTEQADVLLIYGLAERLIRVRYPQRNTGPPDVTFRRNPCTMLVVQVTQSPPSLCLLPPNDLYSYKL